MSHDLTLFLAQNDAPPAAPGAPIEKAPTGAPAGQPVTSTSSTPAPAPHPADTGFFSPMNIPILLICVYLAYLFWDHSRKSKKREAAVNELKKGDKIYTHGGIIGVITDIDGAEAVIKLEDNQKIRILRTAIAGAYEAGKAAI